MKRVLISFTGSQDPYSNTVVDGQECAGPILNIMSEKPFDVVCLFGTPGEAPERWTERTENAISKNFPQVELKTLHLPVSDPTNYHILLRHMRGNLREITSQYDGSEFHISVTSGTPQMHFCWLMLVAGGELNAKILQSLDPRFNDPDKSLVREVDYTDTSFPSISSSDVARYGEATDDSLLASVRQEIGLIGQDPEFIKALNLAARVAAYDAPVLIMGETGTGKELFGQLIHKLSAKTGPFGCINCGALPEELVESQLFGHEEGAFTGARKAKEGVFKAHINGTVVLDEFGELSPPIQTKLLRFLESGEIQPVGHASASLETVNTRIIAATNRDLVAAQQEGAIRDDLLHRFQVEIEIPTLRDRPGDITLLANAFLERFNRKTNTRKKVSQEGLSALLTHSWPGNVRELKNTIEKSALLSDKEVLGADDILFRKTYYEKSSTSVPTPFEGFSLTEHISKVRKEIIRKALDITEGNQAQAAKLLGVTAQSINKFLKAEDA